jgi:Uncharacterised nucleotidyltransferase
MRAQQLHVLQTVVARVRDGHGETISWPLAEVQLAGLATGLTALADTMHVFDDSDPVVASYLADQVAEVARRAERFHAVTPKVLSALADADVPALPVKGAVLGGSAGDPACWPMPLTRPMSDIDLLVPSQQRAQAAAVLVRAGWALHETSDHEDTFLAWGDGSVGRLDGESADHNGRVEVHPGWVEFVHGYLVRGFPLRPHTRRLPDGQARLGSAAFAAHVIGHLASTVVRAEVRAVNVLDVWFLHDAGLDWDAVGSVQTEIDPRLTAPGLWLIDRVLPGLVPPDLLARELARLPHPEVLTTCDPAAVLRDPAPRTTSRWRASFAMSSSERAAVAGQMGRSALGRMRRH